MHDKFNKFIESVSNSLTIVIDKGMYNRWTFTSGRLPESLDIICFTWIVLDSKASLITVIMSTL